MCVYIYTRAAPCQAPESLGVVCFVWQAWRWFVGGDGVNSGAVSQTLTDQLELLVERFRLRS